MRINTSRQTIAAKQRVANYHPSGAIAQHVLETTVQIESAEPVLELNGSFWVASKFAHRYYRTTVDAQGQWFCSARDERVAANCKALVQAYLSGKHAA